MRTASPTPPERTALLSSPSAADMAAAAAILAEGSKSFAAASLLLPSRMRAASAAVYAFCRVSDDAVDLSDDPSAAVIALRARLDRIYAGQPDDDPVDRGFASVVAQFGIPRQVPDALIEGYAWDAEGCRYETIEELRAYCVRVASSVGVMMTLLMGPRDPEALARATDLGIAMQLTNIARDVGEDARNGRIYLPLAWLREEGIDARALVARPEHSDALGRVVRRLLEAADEHYARADAGISLLPVDCRIAIRAARLIYADIGRVIRRAGCDSVGSRAFTSKLRKVWLVVRSLGSLLWNPRPLRAAAHPEATYLVEAVAAS